MVEDTTAQQIPQELLTPVTVDDAGKPNGSKRSSMNLHKDGHPTPPPLRVSTPALEENVKATLSPLLSPGAGNRSPRTSHDTNRSPSEARKSVDLSRVSRRSMELSRLTMDGGSRSLSASA